jgi:hypothetical protein
MRRVAYPYLLVRLCLAFRQVLTRMPLHVDCRLPASSDTKD